jgi:hypothetical protein
MENQLDATSQPRKEWVPPELNKVDVEEITALSGGGGADGFDPS